MSPLAAFAVALPLGAICVVIPLAITFRRTSTLKPISLPAGPGGDVVLPGTRSGAALNILSAAGFVLLFLALAFTSRSPEFRVTAPVVIAVNLALLLLTVYVERRTGERFELDEEGFRVGGPRLHYRVRWIHITDLRADGDVIRFRVNRALVRGRTRRYWDGAIRNRWGVDTNQLLRLLERYRARAMDRAPHFLTGRPERSG